MRDTLQRQLSYYHYSVLIWTGKNDSIDYMLTEKNISVFKDIRIRLGRALKSSSSQRQKFVIFVKIKMEAMKMFAVRMFLT